MTSASVQLQCPFFTRVILIFLKASYNVGELPASPIPTVFTQGF